MQGIVLGDRILLEIMDDNKKESQQEKMAVRLLRESSFTKYRQIAVGRINEMNKN